MSVRQLVLLLLTIICVLVSNIDKPVIGTPTATSTQP